MTVTITPEYISPNGDGIQDTALVDLLFSERVRANVDIVDENGTKEKDFYDSSGVTNPLPRIWDGSDNGGSLVDDGVYTVTARFNDVVGNTVNATSGTIIVDTCNPDVDAGTDVITNTSLSITGSTTDTLSGVASVVWYQVGGPAGGLLSFDSTTTKETAVHADLDGVYSAQFSAIDRAGNRASDETVVIWDTTAPALSLIGDADVVMRARNDYVEKGVEAIDAIDGDITDRASISGIVDALVPGVYTVTYSSSDRAGNVAPKVVRTVTVRPAGGNGPISQLPLFSSARVLGAVYDELEDIQRKVQEVDEEVSTLSSLIATYISEQKSFEK
jgi:hypothetical protein